MRKNILKNNSGITLIALAITIIILLILSAISLNMILGQNGILEKAQDASSKTSLASLKEQVQTDIMAEQSGNKGNITDYKIKEILEKYGTINYEEDGKTFKSLTTFKGNEIPIAEIYTGTTYKEPISKSQSYTGFYADIDDDGTVDGVIYADLITGAQGDGQWKNEVVSPYYTPYFPPDGGDYIIPKIPADSVKNYYISQESFESELGTKPVLSILDNSGTDRFYVMSLTRFTPNLGNFYLWYKKAYTNMNDYETFTSTDFGTGKENTLKMIDRWNDRKNHPDGQNLKYTDDYGEAYDWDIWNVVQDDVKKGWFVPSRAEMAAYEEELKIDNSKEGYSTTYWDEAEYWTSSQNSKNGAWIADLLYNNMRGECVSSCGRVRLSITY